MSPSKAQTNGVQRLPTINNSLWFRSSATWTQMAGWNKIYEQLQSPLKRAWVNSLNQWSGWWHREELG